MKKGRWILGGYAALATAGLLYFALRPAAPSTGVEAAAAVAEEPAARPSGVLTVEEAVGKAADPGAPILDRVAALSQLPKDISIGELNRLQVLVDDRAAPPTVRNDALGAMVNAGHPMPGVLSRLAAMWRDGTEDMDWRVYCLQYLEIAYARDPEGQALAERTLRTAMRDAEPHFSGTALLSMARLGDAKPDMKAAAREMAESMMERFSPAAAPTLPMATALQVARSTGSPLALPQARRVAADDRVAVLTRLSALNVLGEAGTEADAALLAGVKEDAAAEPQLRRVATHALDRLGSRLRIRVNS